MNLLAPREGAILKLQVTSVHCSRCVDSVPRLKHVRSVKLALLFVLMRLCRVDERSGNAMVDRGAQGSFDHHMICIV